VVFSVSVALNGPKVGRAPRSSTSATMGSAMRIVPISTRTITLQSVRRPSSSTAEKVIG
jgi:ADP-ribosylglycohydrolase